MYFWGFDKTNCIGDGTEYNDAKPGSTISKTCCLEPAVHKLNCIAANYEGWNGGYVRIDGQNYCDSFAGETTSVNSFFFVL